MKNDDQSVRARCVAVDNGKVYGGEVFDKNNNPVYVDPIAQIAQTRQMRPIVVNTGSYVNHINFGRIK